MSNETISLHIVSSVSNNDIYFEAIELANGNYALPVINPGTDKSFYQTSELEASTVIKDSAGTLFSVYGYNSGPQQWIHIFNSTTVPSNDTIPNIIMKVEANNNFFWEDDDGIPFDTGISISNSSVATTKTVGSADCKFLVKYK